MRRIDFQTIPWAQKSGARTKAFEGKNYRMRIVRFEENFEEDHWCHNGHYGYVLDGRMTIDFHGTPIAYNKGDGFFIEPGDGHKARVGKGEFVSLLLFEKQSG